jgi:hypothetical protein
MLILSQRGCQLGDDASSKGKEGEQGEKLRTLTFELEGLILDDGELNALLAEPHAWDVLYDTSGGGAVPFLKCLKALEIDKPMEHAYVTLTYGIDRKVLIFSDCKLSKVKLVLQEGGNTSLSCKVTATPVLDESLAELFDQFGKHIECELRADNSTQQDLPLNQHGEGEQKEKPKRRGRPRKERPAATH